MKSLIDGIPVMHIESGHLVVLLMSGDDVYTAESNVEDMNAIQIHQMLGASIQRVMVDSGLDNKTGLDRDSQDP